MKFKEGKIIEKLELEDGREVVARFVKPSDARGLMLLTNSLVDENAFLTRMEHHSLAQEKRIVKEYLKDSKKGKAVSFVLESNKKIIGSIGGTCQDGAMSHVIDIGIVIHKGFRGVGLGKKSLKFLIDLIKKNTRAEILRLHVYGSNKHAISLYKRFGFREVGIVKKCYKLKGKYHSRLIMVKYL